MSPFSLPSFRSRSLRHGFTLVELLTVIGVIALLAGLLIPILAESRRRARVTQCRSQLKQFFSGIQMYENEHGHMSEAYPNRLIYLYRDQYIADPRVFLCPLDPSQGKEGGKPPKASGQFAETDEGPGRGNPIIPVPSDPKVIVPYSSYLYEFSEAPCSWWNDIEYGPEYVDDDIPYQPADPQPGDPSIHPGELIDTNFDGVVTWQETKIYQQYWGDPFLHETGNWNGGYPATWFPMIR